jgi:hypothetical protein
MQQSLIERFHTQRPHNIGVQVMSQSKKSPLAEDLLTGMEAIANYLDWPLRRVQNQIYQGRLPVKRFGQIITSRKSELDRLFSANDVVA